MWLWKHWEAGPTRPLLGRDELHVWGVDLRQVADVALSALSEQDRTRAVAIDDARTRRRWASSRAMLRSLLGRYLRLSPAAVPIVTDQHGKPSLASVRGARLDRRGPYFSLSHSGHVALYAFAASGPIGVDVQLARNRRPARVDQRPAHDHVALARRAFGEHEAERLRAIDPARREVEFLRLWTRHEAGLKQRGTGIWSASVSSQGAAWAIDLDIGAGAAAALACAEPPRYLRRWECF
jgi:4'-phosphopantetheinyl transferase